MTILQGILLTVLGMLILLGLCWGLLRWDKRKIKLNEYDERQNVERGNAYKISFWIGIVYYLVVVTLGAFDKSTDDLLFLVMLGILIQFTAFNFCCMLTNAEISLQGNTVLSIVMDFILGAHFLFKPFRDAFRSDITFGTKVSELRFFGRIELYCGVALISMGLIQLIKNLYQEKE